MKKYIVKEVISAEHANGPMGYCGYRVKYTDGHESWVSDEDFKSTCHAIDDGMTFGDALYFLKRGKKVTRKGWKGKGMYIWLYPEHSITNEEALNSKFKSLGEMNTHELVLGTICMYTPGRKAILTSWVASQEDMLSEDWGLVD